MHCIVNLLVLQWHRQLISQAYDGTFGGATYEQTFTFPTGAEVWAGFANQQH